MHLSPTKGFLDRGANGTETALWIFVANCIVWMWLLFILRAGVVKSKHLPLEQLPDSSRRTVTGCLKGVLNLTSENKTSFLISLLTLHVFSLYLPAQLWCDYLILWEKPWRQCYHLFSSHNSHLVHQMAGFVFKIMYVCVTPVRSLLISSTILWESLSGCIELIELGSCSL